ncbi:hypothetical protein LTS03_008660 [Exophiala xenobiotica]|nr:hypothetical protein LTR72_006386 [Exophiala xenobiotica]KAK5252909.1 hypothetical protein LTS06_002621 [Exophiala xenobiotica]KAK5295164.1 hypothetical protein LTR14_004334 [Exophiala xenobiotica]KAK5366747.1 hypothetical protein LTS03_008660 [Exophiala xenobiotica]KAK5370595.1 hypothetical protein LTR11_006806 [Exophiala xenobiotica]
MAAYLLGFVFTGLSSDQVSDDGFFNEPSTMRPQLTAAAAKDNYSATDDDLPSSSPSPSPSPSLPSSTASTYQVIARGLPGARIHYAAPSA